jgi:alkanesulfonate monooxygenase SsuD/methylene tetrahydromethanopterin reductase-like flavin-dependent oxidoreductase (luciferase family)
VLEEGPVTWSGTVRPPLEAQEVYPKTEKGRIEASVGVGGSPESVVRAAKYGFPLALAIIGGDPARFAPYAELYHRALKEFGRDPLPISVHSPGFVAETDEEAGDIVWPHAKVMNDRIGAERGWPPITRGRFNGEIRNGAQHIGAPETVAHKIARTVRAIGAQRFDLKYSNGPIPHEHQMKAIELYGTKVIPRVRELLAEEPVSSAQ